MRRRRGIMGLNVGTVIPIITATATGNPLSFITDMVRPLKSLEIPFTPIQSGSGDPSPDNVRPISGWTGCEIQHTGKNLVPDFNVTYEFWSDGWLNNSGGISPSSNPYITSAFVEIKPKNSYIFSSNSSGWMAHAFFDKDKIFIPGTYKETNSGTAPQNAKYIRISLTPNKSGKTYFPTEVQLELGTTVTGRENYVEPVSIPITFTNPSTGDPLTVYGGTVTLNEDGSADVVSDRTELTLTGDENWTKNGTNEVYNASLLNGTNFSSYISGICSHVGKDANVTGCINNAVLVHTYGYRGLTFRQIKTYWGLPDNEVSTWKAYLSEQFADGTPIQIVAKLREPQTYHFSNVGQLKAFLGTNTIWTDTNGINTATYLKHQS